MKPTLAASVEPQFRMVAAIVLESVTGRRS